MGNSPSRAPSADVNLFGPKSSSRRRSNADFSSTLHVPGSSSHRRTRSTSAAVSSSSRALLEPPPPPYSAAIQTPPPVPPHDSSRPRGSNRRRSSQTPTISRSRSAGSSTSATVRNAPTVNSGSSRAGASSRNLEYLRTPMRRESVEDALEILRKYDTVIIVDDSSSMRGKLWQEAKDALSTLAEVSSQYDTDGIDVHFLNNRQYATNVDRASTVNRLFERVQPKGITPIAEKLEELLLGYIDKLEQAKTRGETNIKPVNFIMLTDGRPTDEPLDVIVTTAKRLDRGNFPITQVGIQFVQIGDSPEATRFLQELDDDLATTHDTRDIVDTTPYLGGQLTAEILTKILLGGINRRVDRRGGQSVMT